MPLEREMLPDQPEAREKFLCAFRVAKATHATLAFAGRLVAVLCTIVQPSCSFGEHVLHAHQLRDLGFCRRIAAQLIRDNLARHWTRAQHTLEEAFGGGLVPPLLYQDVEFGAMLVHRTPQQVRFATQGDEQVSRPGEFHPEPLAEPCVNLSIYTAPVIHPLPPETASAQTVAGTPSSSCATTRRYAVYVVAVFCTCTGPSVRACGLDTDRAPAWPSDRKPRNSSTNHVSWGCIDRPVRPVT